MRSLLKLSAGLMIALVATATAAEGYPEKPVAIVVPYPAGGGIDGSARIFAEILSKELGQPFMVENRAGAGGLIGVRAVATAKPDGYTLLCLAKMRDVIIQHEMYSSAHQINDCWCAAFIGDALDIEVFVDL